jgi:hypothetical protein
LAWSLARFQVGEAGEGRIARDIWRIRLRGIDDDYRNALGLFVKEEGRHARILSEMVRCLGGTLLAGSWTERLFVVARRLLDVRLKLLVLLAAEVVGIGFYGLCAGAFPSGPLRAALEQIRDDERAHLRFHRDFFQTEVSPGWRRRVFRIGWTLIGSAASLVVLLDHRRTLRTLGVPMAGAARSLARLVGEAGRLEVLEPAPIAFGATTS